VSFRNELAFLEGLRPGSWNVLFLQFGMYLPSKVFVLTGIGFWQLGFSDIGWRGVICLKGKLCGISE